MMPTNMCYGSLYDKVVKYDVKAECREPLHVGSGEGEQGEILVHPILGQPFLQATGLAGAFRDFFADDERLQKELFGTQDGEETIGSKVQFSDAFFDEAAVYTELRPRVRIDRKTGTCQTNKLKGGSAQSGQKFEMESVAAGSVFRFEIYLYEKEKSYQEEIEKALTALQGGIIQLGGQKSNGCGYVNLKSVGKAVYNMRDTQDRALWPGEKKTAQDILAQLTADSGQFDSRLHFQLVGKTEGSILVKALCVKDYDKDAPDAENIRNHKKQYIIPASSIKGVVRTRMEKICAYKGLDECVIDAIFGKSAEKGGDGRLGCIRFYDCVVGDIEDNDKMPVQKRIHIDKFTGGVMYAGLFSEKSACGEVCIQVDITEAKDARTQAQARALLLLALRDIGIGATPLGSGSSVGRGFIKGDKLTVCKGAQKEAEIDFGRGAVTVGEEAINGYLGSLKE